MANDNVFWGHHLLLDCSGCNKHAIADYQTVHDFAKQLVKDIDMVAYGEPQIVNFGTENKAGFTLVQLIETSNICAHFANEDGAIYLDVFSCKTFDPNAVIAAVKQYFDAVKIRMNYITRNAD